VLFVCHLGQDTEEAVQLSMYWVVVKDPGVKESYVVEFF
jgi:hypothetical protein